MTTTRTVLLWLALWGAATVAVVAWLTSQVPITAEDRTDVIVGTAAVTAFVTGAVACALRAKT